MRRGWRCVRGERDPCRCGASYLGSFGMFFAVLALCCHDERGDEGSDVWVEGGQSVACRQGSIGEVGEVLPGRMLTSRRSSRRTVMMDSRSGSFGAAAAAAGATGITPMVLVPVTKLLSDEFVASGRGRGLAGGSAFSPSRYENLLTATVWGRARLGKVLVSPRLPAASPRGNLRELVKFLVSVPVLASWRLLLRGARPSEPTGPAPPRSFSRSLVKARENMETNFLTGVLAATGATVRFASGYVARAAAPRSNMLALSRTGQNRRVSWGEAGALLAGGLSSFPAWPSKACRTRRLIPSGISL